MRYKYTSPASRASPIYCVQTCYVYYDRAVNTRQAVDDSTSSATSLVSMKFKMFLLSEPKKCLIINIIWDNKTELTLTIKDPVNGNTAVVKCIGIW